AGDLAAKEIRTAPPLRLPSGPAAGDRRRHAPRRWIRWAVPLAAAATVVALAVSLVLVKGAREASVVPLQPTASAGPAVSAGPGGVPRYYVASAKSNHLVAGDSVTGKILANLALPVRKGFTYFTMGITASADDRTFAVAEVAYSNASLQGRNALEKATGTASWYAVRLAPGTTTPARLTRLPVKPRTVHGGTALEAVAAALSGSGTGLAVTTVTGSGGLAVQVFSVATGQLLHEWTSNDPPVDQPSLTWIDGDRELAVETSSVGVAGTRGTDTVRELSVSGPASGDLLADGKVVWNVQLGQHTPSLLRACTEPPAELGTKYHLISADGTAFGCSAKTGPGTDPNLTFLTYPLATGTAVTPEARVDYQLTNMAKKGVTQQQILWISPSGDVVVGFWAIAVKGAFADAPNGLHVGAMSDGKFTPLRFPPGFDQEADVASITW
ncbi:MAG: hypothetical protein ACRDNO_20945, partial [Trebonia sp.]